MSYRKKLIEVALPLEAINTASAHEKSVPRRGHPATMHLWWARRPLAACRAVLFASLVDDPDQPGVPEAYLDYIDQKLPSPVSRKFELAQMSLNEKRRLKLFEFIEKLVQWENSNNPQILKTARELILAATEGNPPPVLDPFCGGGSIPLEAQRLGLEAHGSDLNPVAVLITKALIEIPPKFAGQPPVNPEARRNLFEQDDTSNPKSKIGNPKSTWPGATGLAEDVRYYGKWMRDEAEKRIGHLYPKAKLPDGSEATVIAWLWARTVKCPNPACGAMMPLVRSFSLSSKAGKKAWIEPIIEKVAKKVRFEIRTGNGVVQDGTINRKGANCIICNTAVTFDYIRNEAKNKRMTAKLMAIVAEGQRSRVYLPPNKENETIATKILLEWEPTTDLPTQALGFRVQRYGMTKHSDLFTARQLAILTTFCDLLQEVRIQIQSRDEVSRTNFKKNGEIEDTLSYADTVSVYLSFAIDKLADWSSTICSWIHPIQGVRDTFARQAIPMVWDFVEINPLSNSVGNYWNHVEWVSDGIARLPLNGIAGTASQNDATTIEDTPILTLISTDPPYYDNVPYADLSDFFYIWLRRSMSDVYPKLFGTLLTPKTQELVADQYRHGSSAKAQRFFEKGLEKVFTHINKLQHTEYPLTVYYAFKQAETEDDSEEEIKTTLFASTGWETMLEGLIEANFIIKGTWPLRTERSGRMRDTGSNALASSIVLVCRPRPVEARSATRREFLTALKRELPGALKLLQEGNIAPVDLAQASIGPGMAVFSRYAKVLESDGTPMRVRTALQLINQTLDEVLAEQEGEYDADTRWAVAWFEQFGQQEGPFGTAETLSKAKNTAVPGLVEAGILQSKGGKVRLLKREELDPDWNPLTDKRLTTWEITQHLIQALDKQGESGAADLLAKIGSRGEVARDLAYRLYTTCERKGWAQEALAYNSLVVSWPEISRLAGDDSRQPVVQGNFGF